LSGQDVVVIGGGHNSLVCAAYLARAGRRVTVLERRSTLGGLASSSEFHPGYSVPGLLHDTSRVRPQVIKDLGLTGHGLALRDRRPSMYLPQADGPGILLHPDPAAAADELAKVSAADAKAFAEYCAFFKRIGGFFAKVMDTEPPEVTRDDLSTVWQLFKLGFGLRRLGADDMSEIMRVPTMTVADWLRERFENDLLVAGLAAPACFAGYVGPHSPSTTANLLIYESLRGPGVQGGPAALVSALEKACTAANAVIRTDAPVSRIRIESGRAVGVTLEDGTNVDGLVVSGCDPKRTLLSLVHPADLPSPLGHDVGNYRMRGTTAKVNLALSAALDFAGRPGQAFEAVRIADDVDTVERAFDAVKYRQTSEIPHLDIRVPTVSDSSLAPQGHHVASVIVHFTPYHRDGGWTDERRQALGDQVLARLKRYAPNLDEVLVGRQVLTPQDLEDEYGLTEGHIYHGEHALDQLVSMRPLASCAGHKTPVDDLYLCGGGTHPGGGISGGAGRLAAAAVLRA